MNNIARHRFICIASNFFAAPAVEVARHLLGHWLISRTGKVICGGRIVEVEAYHEADPASHSHPGPTDRNRAMFGPPGRAYVYLSYGVHHCINVVCGANGVGEAVLFRGLAPEFGIDLMAQRRRTEDIHNLLSGPGKICQALGIDRSHDHMDLCNVRSQIFLARAPDAQRYIEDAGKVSISPRIGLTKAADAPLRYFLNASPYVSRRPRKR